MTDTVDSVDSVETDHVFDSDLTEVCYVRRG